MFFEIWKEDFINKMEEEMKKRRAEAKSRRKNRQKTQEANTRVAKETQKIIPLWVRRFDAKLNACFCRLV